NPAWTCTIIAPDSSTSTLTLYDDGAHGDSLASDGIFGNTFSPSGPIGFYELNAQATLADGVTVVARSDVELAPYNDLAVLSDDVTVSRNSVLAGDSVQVMAVVHNFGANPAFGAKVEAWDDSTGVLIDSVRVDLPAGGSAGISVPWKVAL